jgi:hypothetical protein
MPHIDRIKSAASMLATPCFAFTLIRTLHKSPGLVKRRILASSKDFGLLKGIARARVIPIRIKSQPKSQTGRIMLENH